jgi:uncharacterized protein (TIGR03790 family)
VNSKTRLHSGLDLVGGFFQFSPAMHSVVLRFFLLGCLLLPGLCAGAEDASPAARILLLANSADAESVRLARYYMEKRHVPAANLIALPMPAGETITWRQFIDSIDQPAQDELIKRGWIQAIETSLTDKMGRRKYAISGHRIAYLVVCRGVPLRIEHDQALYEATPPLTDNPQFRNNGGAVDAELALLARSTYPINAFVPNPLFCKDHPTFIDEAQVVKVSRLDGPTYDDAAALVDHALKAEQQGLIGRAYVDLGGPHPDGDKWLENVASQLDALEFDLDVDRKPTVFPATVRFDAPVLYFGWYAGALCGPFALPGFRFPPGAIALHIHSFSAATVRSASAGWCGPLVARGVTATFGNVYEPYLTFTHQPYLLLHALANGMNLGDAACFALPVLSWQAVVIGDPLYRPFAVSFADQWQRRRELPDELFPYVVCRYLIRLERAGQTGQAAKVAADELHARPGLVVALRTAGLLKASGDAAGALRAFDPVLPLRTVPLSLIPVAAEVAQFCTENGAPQKAVDVYRSLLAIEKLSLEQRLVLLPRAMKAAEATGDTEVLGLWKQMLEGLTPKQSSALK